MSTNVVPANPPNVVQQRLAELWAAGEDHEFYALVQRRLAPIVTQYLRLHNAMTEEDARDCFALAVSRFFEASLNRRDAVANPYSYIWQAAKHAAIDWLNNATRERDITDTMSRQMAPDRGHHHEALHSEYEDGAGEPTEEDRPFSAAVALVEGLCEDADVEPSAAIQIVALAVSRLCPPQKRVIEAILTFGPDYNASEAPQDLGINPSTYRVTKGRAYSELRKIIPCVLNELGIELRFLAEPAAVSERRAFPSEVDPGEAP